MKPRPKRSSSPGTTYVSRLWAWGLVVAICSLHVVPVSALAQAPAQAPAPAPEPPEPERASIESWAFLIGEWEITESRYESNGELVATSTGQAVFHPAMHDERIEELQVIRRDDGAHSALQIIAPGREPGTVEVARTDDDHGGFWVIAGTLSADRMDLTEKHPDPTSRVTRRITYLRQDDDHVVRRLEFSTDGGEHWFVRSEIIYDR